jgi:hypothetical protein
MYLCVGGIDLCKMSTLTYDSKQRYYLKKKTEKKPVIILNIIHNLRDRSFFVDVDMFYKSSHNFL